MKKTILLSILMFCAAGFQPATAQLIFSNQVIAVDAANLSIESVEYTAASIVTNTASEWISTTAVYQGGLFGNYESTTNAVGQQVLTDVVTTNAATWICNVIFELPKGHPWELSGFPVSVQRFKVTLQVPVDPDAVSGLLGDSAAAGLQFAAANGAYQPAGQIKDAFLSMAAAVLAAGNQ